MDRCSFRAPYFSVCAVGGGGGGGGLPPVVSAAAPSPRPADRGVRGRSSSSHRLGRPDVTETPPVDSLGFYSERRLCVTVCLPHKLML